MVDSTEQRDLRIEKLDQLRESGIDPYPARIECTHTAAEAIAAFEAAPEDKVVHVAVAGRLLAVRVMGKSSFAHLQDGSGRIQFYVRKDIVGDEAYDAFKKTLDVGDFCAVSGELFRTHSGEVTVKADSVQIVSKALRPMPEKFHGIKDVETRFRQRYLDLMANEETRDIFIKRTHMVTAIRRYLDEKGFIEVETPVLQPIYGGAAAKPFVTQHNALERTLYLRIADELYLKRLIIGGLDRVYEIGHNFRNEGLDTKHNPEFTSIELYQAYADYNQIMALVEDLWSTVAQQVLGTMTLTYADNEIDLTPPWKRITMRDAILEGSGLDIEEFRDLKSLLAAAREKKLPVAEQPTWGKMVDELFSECVEPSLIQPTFIIDYPVEISPLAKRKADAPHLVERFEFFMGSMECGNAFSELNDPLDQRERFKAQLQDSAEGDEEAHPMDEDFLLAMEHGMPPTGGLGFGIDRMAMLLTNQTSIREVILFPQLRN